MGGGSGGGGGSSVTHYAPYVEDQHYKFLNEIDNYVDLLKNDSPFSGFTAYDIDTAFFGSGVSISSFAALFDQYNDYIIDLDIDTQYNNIFSDTVNSSEVAALIAAEGTALSDDLETEALPRLMTGIRDINAVNNSSFVIAKALLETNRQKQLAKFSANIKYRLIPFAYERWKTYLSWNQYKVSMYAELVKLYLSAKMDFTAQNYEIIAKDKIWPFTIFEYQRAAIGALQGGIPHIGNEGPSTAQKVIGGALSGAAAGATVGSAVPAIGTTVGAVVGAVFGMASAFV